MIYSARHLHQPWDVRFGDVIQELIDSGRWDRLDIGVAWVLKSGMDYLSEALKDFLQKGKQLSVTVGLDFEHTSKEGLQALIDLEQYGNCETVVFHNANGGSVFHPKQYLFRNSKDGCLLLGSNNITKSGLYKNVETATLTVATIDEQIICSATETPLRWRNASEKLVIRLNDDSLDWLVEHGKLKIEEAEREKNRETGKSKETESESLFGSKYISAPKPKVRQTAPSHINEAVTNFTYPTASGGNTLLVRLRIANKKNRPQQTQIPFRLLADFFDAAPNVTSSVSGKIRNLRIAYLNGNPNTIKLNLPEIRDLDQPVARFVKTPNGIFYEVYDANSLDGREIMAALEEGILEQSTKMSVRNQEKATWWRIV